MIDPGQREARVWTAPTDAAILTAGREIDGGQLIPGFRLPLSALLDDDPEAE